MLRPTIDQQVTFLYTRDLPLTAQFYEQTMGLPLVLDQGSCRIYRVGADSYLGFCHREEIPAQPEGAVVRYVISAWDADPPSPDHDADYAADRKARLGTEVDIPHPAVAFLRVRVIDSVATHVDDERPRFNPVPLDHLGPAHGGDQDVGFAHHARQVLSAGVADGHSGISLHQQQRYRHTDNIRASQHNGVCSFHGNTRAHQ